MLIKKQKAKVWGYVSQAEEEPFPLKRSAALPRLLCSAENVVLSPSLSSDQEGLLPREPAPAPGLSSHLPRRKIRFETSEILRRTCMTQKNKRF